MTGAIIKAREALSAIEDNSRNDHIAVTAMKARAELDAWIASVPDLYSHQQIIDCRDLTAEDEVLIHNFYKATAHLMNGLEDE